MDVGRTAWIAQPASCVLHLAEPAEEEEEIAGPNTLSLEMGLRRAGLPEAGEPPRHPQPGMGIEVRIEVCACRSTALIACQLRDDPVQTGSATAAIDILETKIVVDKKTDVVLGVHIVGPEATELIAEGTLAIEMGARVEDIAATIHAHPTLPEAVMEAAEAVHGIQIHSV